MIERQELVETGRRAHGWWVLFTAHSLSLSFFLEGTFLSRRGDLHAPLPPVRATLRQWNLSQVVGQPGRTRSFLRLMQAVYVHLRDVFPMLFFRPRHRRYQSKSLTFYYLLTVTRV